MNKTVEVDATEECTRCAPESLSLDDNRGYMDGMLDDYSYDDDLYDDSYYDMTDSIDEVYELSYLPQTFNTVDITDNSYDIEDSELFAETRNGVETTSEPPPIVDIIEETLEENNNDPNNNMDSIQMSLEAPPVVASGKLHEESRVPSPLPGCSKDSVLLPDEPPIAEMLIEQTRHVLGLVSRIHRDSVFEARQRDQVTPVSELRLWDLIPEADRLEFPDSIVSNKKPKIATKSNAQVSTNPTNNTSTMKRGPNEDLCTIGCKRSSSTPDISLSVPMVKPGEIAKVPSTSQIATVPKIVPEPGKIRAVPLEHSRPTYAPLKVTESPCAVSTPKVATTRVTVGRGAIAKIGPESPLRGNQAREQALPPTFVRPQYRPMGRPAPTQPVTDVQGTITSLRKHEYDVVATRKTATNALQPANRLATGPVPHTQTQENRQARPAATALQPANRLATGPVPHTQTQQNRQAQPVRTALQTANRLATGPVSHTSIQQNRQAQPVATSLQPPNTRPTLRAPHTQTQQNHQAQPAATALQPANRLAISPALRMQIQKNRQALTTGTALQRANRLATGPVPHTQTQQNRQALPTATALQRANRLATGPVPHTQTQQNRQAQPVATALQPANRLATGAVPRTQTQQNRQAQPVATPLQPANRLATGAVPRTQQIEPAVVQEIEPAVEPINRIVCMEIYYKLINIFPNVDRAYVKRLCPPDWAPGDRDTQVASLVEMILQGGDAVPKIVAVDYEDREETDGRMSSPDDIYENLLGIFPDADPHFLRDFAEKNAAGPDSLKQFVERNLQKRDYPTREQYMARLKITEQQRQYTHGFDVKQYLSIIPDPAKHFMDPKRRCRHSTVAFEFLKSHFNKMRVSTISRAYIRHIYNMSLTAEYLEQNGSDLKSKRWAMEMPTEDILLLQEIAYIKHKTEITDYIANAKNVEENEFKMLKAQNLLLECQCCFDAECVPSKCCNCENGHIFCNECVVSGTNAKLGDGDTHINCFTNCGSEFSLSVLQRVLAPTTFSILLKKRQAAEVMEAGVEGLVSCPFCHFASIPPEGDKIFKCLNPECTKESCRLCKELSHVPLKCDEVMKADKARLYIEEKMTAALARTCYKCQKSFFKEEGCNKITCVCGAIMCYLCDQPIKDYSHFRGQGSDDQSRCPLYSDTIRLDAVAVRKVAEQAQLEVLKRNPNVKIDTRHLLPAIPRPQRGPHQDVLNADELPRRAQRVLDLPPM